MCSLEANILKTDDILIQQNTLSQVPNPSKYDASTIQKWFEREDVGDMPLEGDDSSIWGKPHAIKHEDGVSRQPKDFIAIHGQSSDIDLATKWLANKLVSDLRITSHIHILIAIFVDTSLA